MKLKLTYALLGLTAILLTTGMSGGCSVFPRSTSTTYYNPNWMPDGRIIAVRERLVQEKGLWGMYPVEDKFHVMAITIDASNEVVREEELFDISDIGIVKEITCSPTGEMIGYIYDGIYITDYQGRSKNKIPGTDATAKYFDWSPDATKIAYTNRNRELHVVNTDGTNNVQITTSAEVVAWRVGEKIVYEDSVYNKIWVSDSGGINKEVIVETVSSKPQISNAGIIIFRGADNKVKSSNMSGTGEAVLFSGYERATLKLSFDNTKIVGGDYSGSVGVSSIYVVNIDGTNAKKLK